MKRLGILLLVAAFMLMLVISASAEQVTLTYSYGQDALNKHLLDIMNTVTYNEKTYVFDFGGFSYNGAFTMLGGNVRTVQESEVPQIRMGIIDQNADLYLGTVKISPPSNMQLYVFSGDRVSGQYTLIDQQNTSSYTMDIYSTRDENGRLRLIDRVFLYSYQHGGEEKYYAASLYVSFQGYEGAAADTSPIDAALVSATPVGTQSNDTYAQMPENQSEDIETYISMVRILEEERTRLLGELEQKTSEAESLQSTNATLTQQNSQLSAEVESLKAQLAAAQDGDADIEALNEQISRLEAEKALLLEDAARVTELTKQVSQLEAEKALLLTRIENMPEPVEDLSATVTKLEEDITALNAQIITKDAQITQLNSDLTAAQSELATQSAQLEADITALNAQINAKNAQIAQLEAQSPAETSVSITESNQPEMGISVAPADGSQKVKPGDVIYSENGITIEYKGISRESKDNLLVEVAITNNTGLDLHMKTYSALVNRCDVGMWNGQITVYDDSVYYTKPNRGWLINEDETAVYGITTIERLDLYVIARRYLENGDLDYDNPFFDHTFTLILDEPFIINDDERVKSAAEVTPKPITTQEPSADLTGTVAQLESDIAVLSAQITAKDALIEQLNKDLEAAQNDLAAADILTGQIAQLKEEKKELQAEADKVAGLTEYIAQLEAENALLRTNSASAQTVPTQTATAQLTAMPTATQVPAATPVPTDEPPKALEVSIMKGQESVIFDQDGVKMTFDGTIEEKDNSPLIVNILVENNTAHTIKISYSGTCNGWGLPKSSVSGNANNVSPGAKAKGFLWFRYEDMNIDDFSELKEGKLTFNVRSTDTSTELFTVPVNITFGEGEAQPVVPTFYEEYPLLPDPTAYGSMYRSSYRGATLVNGVPSSSARYTYKCDRTDKTQEIFGVYIAALKEIGFSVSQVGTEYSISLNRKKVAIATCGERITIEILPAAIGSGSTGSPLGASDIVKKKMGDSLSTSYMTIKTEKNGTADVIYSYEGKEPSLYHIHEAKDGSTYVYVKGTFTNKTGGEISILNIYTNLLINGEYNYKGNVTALNPDGKTFLKYVASQETVTCYVFFEVPDSVAKSMKSAVATLGFMPTFNTLISPAGSGTYNFDYCSDVFEITLVK